MSSTSQPQPPDYCEYANGPCDQSFTGVPKSRALFLYPAAPRNIASAIEEAVRKIRKRESEWEWLTWRDLNVAGQVIFCSICKAARFSDCIVADVTTLNFNLLFEIGFSLGLEIPVIPIRDTSIIRDKLAFAELGLLDTVGYTDFQNSDQLVDALLSKLSSCTPIPTPRSEINAGAPLYVLKGPIDTEGQVLLMSELKKSAARFRTFDTIETPRLSLHEVRKQIGSSLGVIAHLLGPDREGSDVHNARCALTAGIAMALGKIVLMLQEEHVTQPIDYRDIVQSYNDPRQVQKLIEPVILKILASFQDSQIKNIDPPRGLLQGLDIGDVAAENEIQPLRSYFVETGQYLQAKRGHARLVVGRKGSGKTAIFYAVRNSFWRSKSRMVLDLKPEGHQFTKLREVILSRLSPGHQEHTLTAFWDSILLAELAHRISEDERTWAERDPQRKKNFDIVRDLYERCGFAERGDLSERLLHQVDRLVERYGKLGSDLPEREITRTLFTEDIHELSEAIAAYLKEKEEVWLLFDNIDKGWPTRGASNEDILILRTLLEATRKIQRQLERKGVGFHSLVFLRNDIYDHLILETPDKGKDTAITLDWSDPELFQEIFRLRVEASGVAPELASERFDQVWAALIDTHVGTRDTFSYIIDRTLMRPRDFLSFVHRAVEVAINRGHERIHQEDLLQAETLYSEDMLTSMVFELKDVYPEAPEFLYTFLNCKTRLSNEEVAKLLSEGGVPDERLADGINLLAWFGFLGVQSDSNAAARYAYQMRYDMQKLMTPIKRGASVFVVHPAFRQALECIDN